MPDCTFCQRYVHDPDTGKLTLGRDGEPEEREIYNRVAPGTCLPPCRTRKGCPKGTPETPKTLTANNWECLEHYWECKAVGHFPDDAVVRRNAMIIRTIEDEYEKLQRRKELHELIAILTPENK